MNIDNSQNRSKDRTIRRLGLISILVFTVISRLIFKANYLYEWDSVQFALSINKFDVLWHQPHPPGYIWYVLSIRGMYQFIRDGNLAIISTNIFFSLLTLFFFYKLSKLILRDEIHALVTSFILAVNPIFWFNGSTASIYTVEAFISSFMGYLLFKSLKSTDLKYLYLSSFFLGFLGGFRQTSIVLLIPLWLYVLLIKTHSVKVLGVNSIICFVAALSWVIPTIINTGGLQGYLSTSRGLTGLGSEKILIWFGGYSRYLINNAINYAVYLMEGISPIGIGFILYALFLRINNRKKTEFKRENILFFALWMIPSLLLYSFYIEKGGYLSLIIPPLIILFSWSVIFSSKIIGTNKGKKIIQTVIYVFTILVLILWFSLPDSKAGIPQKISILSYIIQPPLSDYNWDISSREIKQKDYVMTTFYNELKNNNFTPQDTLLFWAGGYPTWRHMMYYFPNYISYWLVDSSVSGSPTFNTEYYKADNYQVTSFSGKPFWLAVNRPKEIQLTISENIKTLIWITGSHTTIYKSLLLYPNLLKTRTLPNGQSMIEMSTSFDNIDLGSFSINH